jgi:predicted  nucleic acid-binding Zn-ribbon protein
MDEQLTANETFEALRALEQIDREIAAFMQRLAALEPEVLEAEGRLSELGSRDKAARARIEKIDARLRKFERASEAGRETLKRLQLRAKEVQNLKQHTAVRLETDAARRNLEAADDELLESMQEAEEARGVLAAIEHELEEGRTAYEALKTETGAQRTELEAEISVQRDRRQNRALRLDGAALRLYESVRGGRTRQALASVMPDGFCGHCYTFVPLQRQAEIRAGRRLYLCEGCGIILYPAD